MTRLLTSGEKALILAARLDLSPDEDQALSALLASGLDWEALLDDGETFGILPLLHRQLSRTGFRGKVPARVLDRLDREYLQRSMKSLQLFSILGRIQAALEAASLPVILLKGAFLAPWLYGDPALRGMGDLDLLIRPRDREAVLEILDQIGFRSEQSGLAAQYNGAVDASLFERVSHLPPLFFGRICRLEIHLSIFQDEREVADAVLDGIWESAWRRELPAPACLGLAPETLVLFQAAHLDKHLILDGSGYLYWFCDIHELVKRLGPALDWDRMVDLARTLGKEPALKRTLGVLQANWGTPVPPGLAEAGGLPLTDFFDRGRALRRDPMVVLSWSRIWLRLKQVRQVPGLGARIMFLLTLVVPGRAKMQAIHAPKTGLGLAFWFVAHPFWKAWRILASLARRPG